MDLYRLYYFSLAFQGGISLALAAWLWVKAGKQAGIKPLAMFCASIGLWGLGQLAIQLGDEQLARIKASAARHAPAAYPESGSEEESRKIWLGRKSAFGAMGQINDYMCLDGTIPVSELPFVLRRISEMSAEVGLDVANVFHAGDGNMHPLILYDANKPGDLALCEALGAAILRLCVEVGGCLTGEHGVGIEKRDLMKVQISDADLETQLKVKDVFDPGWLLNPAKVFPLDLTNGRRAS